MSTYPATVIAADSNHTVVRIDATGHVIRFDHADPNAVPPKHRAVGTQGVISFPKAPALFTGRAA